MHEEAGEFHHYPITRLLASLRGCPHLDRLDVRWQLFVPEGQAALENAFDNGRSVRWWETPPATAKTDEDRAKSTRIKPVSEWGTGTDGVPRVLQRDMQGVTRSTTYPSFLTTLESVVDAAAQRKEFPELADVPNDQLPEYFRK